MGTYNFIVDPPDRLQDTAVCAGCSDVVPIDDLCESICILCWKDVEEMQAGVDQDAEPIVDDLDEYRPF